jgi:hypothetical protein
MTKEEIAEYNSVPEKYLVGSDKEHNRQKWSKGKITGLISDEEGWERYWVEELDGYRKLAGDDSLPEGVEKGNVLFVGHQRQMTQLDSDPTEPVAIGSLKDGGKTRAGRSYYLYVNLDERGEYNADVRDIHDETIYEMDTESTRELIEHGFLKYKPDEDVQGLESYLKSVSILNEHDNLMRAYYNEGGEIKEDQSLELPSGATVNDIKGQRYYSVKRDIKGNTWLFMLSWGKYGNHVTVQKLTNNPFRTLGKDFNTVDEAIAHYKTPAMKTELIFAEKEAEKYGFKSATMAEGGQARQLNAVEVIFENPEYNYTTSVSSNATEESSRKYFVGKFFDVAPYPQEQFEQVVDINFIDNNKEMREGGRLDPQQKKAVRSIMFNFDDPENEWDEIDRNLKKSFRGDTYPLAVDYAKSMYAGGGTTDDVVISDFENGVATIKKGRKKMGYLIDRDVRWGKGKYTQYPFALELKGIGIREGKSLEELKPFIYKYSHMYAEGGETSEIDTYFAEGKYKDGDSFHTTLDNIDGLREEIESYGDELNQESITYYIRYADGMEEEVTIEKSTEKKKEGGKVGIKDGRCKTLKECEQFLAEYFSDKGLKVQKRKGAKNKYDIITKDGVVSKDYEFEKKSQKYHFRQLHEDGGEVLLWYLPKSFDVGETAVIQNPDGYWTKLVEVESIDGENYTVSSGGEYHLSEMRKYKKEDGGATDDEVEEAYIEYLNEIGESYDYEDDQWIIGGESRAEDYWGRYGEAMRDHDPIGFNVGKGEFEREQYKKGGETDEDSFISWHANIAQAKEELADLKSQGINAEIKTLGRGDHEIHRK